VRQACRVIAHRAGNIGRGESAFCTAFCLARPSAATKGIEEAWGHPIDYVPNSKISREDFALQLAQQRGIEEGLVAILRCVEPCYSCKMKGNWQEKKLQLHYGPTKCLHYYHYYLDRRFGLIATRGRCLENLRGTQRS